MFRYAVPVFLTSALLLGAYTTEARAQWGRAPAGNDLSGRYINQSNGGQCFIYRQGGSYVFTNENGTPARFVYVGPNQFRMVGGDWDPRTVATVLGRDPSGRMVIRFVSTGPPGYWVQED